MHTTAKAKESIGIGVVGCGYWGPNLIRNFNGLQDCRLRALADLSVDRLDHMQRLYPGVGTYTDFDEMLKSRGVEAVVVATPVRTHFKFAKAALLADKHVFIEKPMASTSAECEELIRIAEDRGLTLMIGHTFLYSAPVKKIAEIVKTPEFGEVQSINSQRLNLGLFQNDINVAWDLAPHDVSIILHILGDRPSRVNCQGVAHYTEGIEDVANMSLAFPGNRFATIQSSWLEPRKVRTMTIVGKLQMIVYDDLQPLEKIRLYDTRVDLPPHTDSFAEFQYSYHYGDIHIPKLDQEEPLKTECQHFLDCISNGEQPKSCGRKGLELVRILEASSESLRRNGAPVEMGDS